MTNLFSFRRLDSILRTLTLVALAVGSVTVDASAQRRATSRRSGGATTTATTTTPSSGSSSTRHGASVDAISYGGVVGTTYLLYSTGGHSFNGLGYHIGAVVDLPVAERVGLVGRVGYESKVGGGTVTDGGVSAAMSFNHDYVELSGAVRYDVAPAMLVEGGIALQLGTGGTFRVDATDGEDRISAGRDGELTMPTQVAITAGTGYRIKVGPTAEIIPHASFNLFLTSPTPGGSASSHTIRVGTRVMFN